MIQLGEMLKRVVGLKAPLAHREKCLLVREMYEMMDWLAAACALHEHMLATRITRAEHIFSGMCAYTE